LQVSTIKRIVFIIPPYLKGKATFLSVALFIEINRKNTVRK